MTEETVIDSCLYAKTYQQLQYENMNMAFRVLGLECNLVVGVVAVGGTILVL